MSGPVVFALPRAAGAHATGDVVRRLAGERSWTEVAGILTDEEADDPEAAIDEGREHGDRVARELGEATGSDG